MKTTTFIFLLSLISNLSIAQQLEGIYVFKASAEKENHYLVFDTQGGKSISLYYGSQNRNDHIYYYPAELNKLKLDGKGNIEFEIGKRQLFETSQFKIIKHESHRDKPVGSSKSVLKYKGQIIGNQIKLTCSSKVGDCWQKEIIFEKVD